MFPKLTVATSKDYQHESNFSFPTISSTTPHLSYNVPNVTFAAARVQINITAEILNEIKSAPPYNFYIQPKGECIWITCEKLEQLWSNHLRFIESSTWWMLLIMPFQKIILLLDPSPPGLVKTVFTNDTNNVTIVTLTSSSDENGPIRWVAFVRLQLCNVCIKI